MCQAHDKHRFYLTKQTSATESLLPSFMPVVDHATHVVEGAVPEHLEGATTQWEIKSNERFYDENKAAKKIATIRQAKDRNSNSTYKNHMDSYISHVSDMSSSDGFASQLQIWANSVKAHKLDAMLPDAIWYSFKSTVEFSEPSTRNQFIRVMELWRNSGLDNSIQTMRDEITQGAHPAVCMLKVFVAHMPKLQSIGEAVFKFYGSTCKLNNPETDINSYLASVSAETDIDIVTSPENVRLLQGFVHYLCNQMNNEFISSCHMPTQLTKQNTLWKNLEDVDAVWHQSSHGVEMPLLLEQLIGTWILAIRVHFSVKTAATRQTVLDVSGNLKELFGVLQKIPQGN